jgi:D-aminoacyl-tRNA deacylase
MRVVIQRVSSASVSVDKKVIGSCSHGLLILAGIEEADTEEDATWLSAKIVNLRIFNDAEGKMNLSLKKESGKPVATGEFGAHMDVSLVNDGPVTIIIDSKNKE